MSDHDPLDTTSLDKARESRKLRDKLADQSDVEDIKWLMSSKRGRRILWRILERAGVFRASFNTNSMTMAFSEGCKNEGLRTIALIHAASPELYPTMLKEANE